MGAHPVLKFSSLDIQKRGGLQETRVLEAEALAALDVGASLAGAVAVEVEFSVGEKEILLQGTARGRWALECSRCLSPVQEPFESPLERTYPISEETIDLTDELRESLVFAVPGKPLCRKDCRGLCPLCGKNLNEGPCGCHVELPRPFEGLKQVKTKDRKER